MIPPKIIEHTIIQTFNNNTNTNSQNNRFLNFELTKNTIIHITHNHRIQTKPK